MFHQPAHKDTEHPAGQALVGDIGHTEVGQVIAFPVPPQARVVPDYVAGAARQAVNPISYDFDFVHHGARVLLEPISANAKEWADLYMPDDCAKSCRAWIVEPHAWANIQDEIDAYGLTFRDHAPTVRRPYSRAA